MASPEAAVSLLSSGLEAAPADPLPSGTCVPAPLIVVVEDVDGIGKEDVGCWVEEEVRTPVIFKADEDNSCPFRCLAMS